MFKRRVGGTYFAIITQAIAAILTILIIGQQGYTGGVNGITDLRTLHGWDIRPDHAKDMLYFVNAGLLIGCVLLAQFIRRSKLGRILVAMRDKEDRVRFSGYDVANFKIFVFCLRGRAGGDRRRDVHPAGRLHVAVIRRHRAVDRDGDLLRRWRPHLAPRRDLRRADGQLGTHHLLGEPAASSGCSPWASLFILVVVAFPNGLAGLYRRYLDPLDRPRRRRTPARRTADRTGRESARLGHGHRVRSDP